MKKSQADVMLTVETEMKFLPLVLSFAEFTSRAFGLSEKDALHLTLASEEIFAYLCRMTQDPKQLTLTMINGIYYALLKFAFEGIDFDPQAFNLTAGMSLDNEGIEELGLLIASRSVERMSIFHNTMEGTGFVLIKEKSYPETDPFESRELPSSEGISVKRPNAEDLRVFARSIIHGREASSYPQDFCYAGKVVDMVESTEYDGLVATDKKGRIAGGILWRYSGTKMIESYGPYIFLDKDGEGPAEELVTGFISVVAKSEAVCIISKYETDELPRGYFEHLGSIDFVRDKTVRASRKFLFRQLKEDPGCRVYSYPGMEGFLEDQYRRHVLAREIVPVHHEGERRNAHSVFAANFQRSMDLVTLTPLWDGVDARENLKKHIDVLRHEGIANIFFEIDLGQGWQVRLYPVIVENGFEPCLIIPYGGRADTTIFCLRG